MSSKSVVTVIAGVNSFSGFFFSDAKGFFCTMAIGTFYHVVFDPFVGFILASGFFNKCSKGFTVTVGFFSEWSGGFTDATGFINEWSSGFQHAVGVTAQCSRRFWKITVDNAEGFVKAIDRYSCDANGTRQG